MGNWIVTLMLFAFRKRWNEVDLTCNCIFIIFCFLCNRGVKSAGMNRKMDSRVLGFNETIFRDRYDRFAQSWQSATFVSQF